MNSEMQVIQDDSIGTDPTIVQTIDSLDIEPGQQNSKKKTNRKKSKTPNPDKKPQKKRFFFDFDFKRL